MLEIFEKHKAQVDFRLVYIREAHAVDSAAPMGPVAAADKERWIEEPVALAERVQLAKDCCVALKLAALPMAVDGMDDAASKAWAAWPERLFLIDTQGKLVYVGAPGPKGFDPEGWEKAIIQLLTPPKPDKSG